MRPGIRFLFRRKQPEYLPVLIFCDAEVQVSAALLHPQPQGIPITISVVPVDLSRSSGLEFPLSYRTARICKPTNRSNDTFGGPIVSEGLAVCFVWRNSQKRQLSRLIGFSQPRIREKKP